MLPKATEPTNCGPKSPKMLSKEAALAFKLIISGISLQWQKENTQSVWVYLLPTAKVSQSQLLPRP